MGFILSDPTKKDTDGDGDRDGKDPNPMRYLLNDNFIEQIENLDKISKKYNTGYDYLMKFNTDKSKWYTFSFIRQFNESYSNTKKIWKVTGGEIDDKFTSYVEKQDKKIYDYFKNKETIYANDKFENLDVKHMSATITGLIYKTDVLDAKYLEPGFKNFVSTEMFEYHLDNLSGWAGDLQTLTEDTMTVIQKNKSNKHYVPTYKEFYDTFKNILLDENYSFDSKDMFADMDAYNIYIKIRNKDIKSALTDYYSNGYKKRFTNFTNNYNEKQLKDITYIYTKQKYLGIVDWPLLENEYNDNHSRAARDAFVGYILSQRSKE